MRFLLGTLCAAALAMPLTVTAAQVPTTDAIPHCGKCKDGEKCEKCKKCKKECDKKEDA